MKFALKIILLILLAIAIPFLFPSFGMRQDINPEQGLPWQIEVDAVGSRVFGLRPGVSTLADVKQRFGQDAELAVIAGKGEVGSLEAYYVQLNLGFVLARGIFTLDVDPDTVNQIRERSPKAEFMDSGARKFALSAADRQKAETLRVRAISVIPSVNLDEAMVNQRFGPPGERIVASETRVHLLYPEKGLEVIVDRDGKELLQYVAPSQFAILRQPLDGLLKPLAH